MLSPDANEEQYQEETTAEAEHQAYEGWTPQIVSQPPELTRWQLSPDEILEFIEHELRGEDFDYDKRIWVQRHEAVLNERGIRAVVSTIRMHVNKITFLTNFTDEHIYEIVYNLANNLTQLLFNNGDEFGINWERSHQNNIVDYSCSLVFAGLRRSYEQGERKFLGSHTKVLHRIDESPQVNKPKKFGIFG